MALVHYEQNLDIPEVRFNFPSFLIEAADKCRAAGRLLSSAELGWGEKPNSDLLNQLLPLKGQWLREIQKLTSHSRDIKQGTSLQEINYWSVLKSSLENIAKLFDSYEVQVLFSVLKTNNLIVSAGTFEVTTRLRSRLEEVTENAELMNGVPINSLLANHDFPGLASVIQQLFVQLKKLKNNRGYPISRMVDFVDLINRDVTNQCISILHSVRLMDIDFKSFSSMMKDCNHVFKVWDDEIISFWQFLKELCARRNDPVLVKFTSTFTPLQQRLKTVQAFRELHNRFIETLQQVIAPQEKEASLVNQVIEAYTILRSVDVSDLSEGAIAEWNELVKSYDHQMESVDQSLAEMIRGKLNGSHSTEQMLQIYGKYNRLFFRRRIQVSIQQYQTSLFKQVRKDADKLYESLQHVSYPDSEACRIARLYDLPPLASSVIWARQIEMKLDTYLHHAEVLLGKDWEKHKEGQKLKVEMLWIESVMGSKSAIP